MMMIIIIKIICFIPLKVLFLFLNRASKIMVFKGFRVVFAVFPHNARSTQDCPPVTHRSWRDMPLIPFNL